MEINLLPDSQKQKRNALSFFTYTTLGFVLVGVILAGFALTLTTIQFTINEKINGYDNQTAALTKRLKEFEKLEKDITSTNKGLHTANAIISAQLRPNTILNTIADTIGPEIVLTNIIVQPQTAATTATAAQDTLAITIDGSANTRAQVIDFKQGLEKRTGFTNIQYTIGTNASADTGQATNTPAFSFTITAVYSKQPDSAS